MDGWLVRQLWSAIVLVAMLLTATLGAGFVAHGLWLLFLYGWETVE
jgi:hypothetical protein